MKFSCCIEMIYTGRPFIERIGAAAAAGFDAFEFWNWDNKNIPAIQAACAQHHIRPAIFQGSVDGVMVDGNDKDVYVAGVKKSIDLAVELQVPALFCMSDVMQEDRSVKPHARPMSPEEMAENSVAVLKELAPYAEKAGITLVCEPLNTLVDHAGYSLTSTRAGVDIIKAVGSPHVRLLYDAYHMQIMEGNIIETIRENVQYIGYFHIADVPGRNQPGTGELNYVNIIKALHAAGYDGTVGFEFTPVGDDDTVARDILGMLKNT